MRGRGVHHLRGVPLGGVLGGGCKRGVRRLGGGLPAAGGGGGHGAVVVVLVPAVPPGALLPLPASNVLCIGNCNFTFFVVADNCCLIYFIDSVKSAVEKMIKRTYVINRNKRYCNLFSQS